MTFVFSGLQSNRFDVFVCFRLKDKFNPRTGKDFLLWFMKKFAKFVLYPFVRPFILLIFGLTFTASLALVFRIQIGLDQNAALPRVYACACVCVIDGTCTLQRSNYIVTSAATGHK